MNMQFLWLSSAFLGFTLQIVFFFLSLEVRGNKSYSVIILGFVPSLILAVHIPALLTEWRYA